MGGFKMINFFAPINNLGYGVHSYNLIKAFDKVSKEPVCLIPPYGQVTWKDKYVKKWLNNQDVIDSEDPGIMIFNEGFLSQFCGKPRIGFPVFELTKFSKRDIAMMETCDHLLTPSYWGKKVLTDNGFRSIYVVPEGVDPEIFYPDYDLDYKLHRIKENGITFVTVGKWELRKGSQDILSAFNAAFANSDQKITLLAHMGNLFDSNWLDKIIQHLTSLDFDKGPHIFRAVGGYFKLNKGNLEIKICNTTLPTHQDMANLYRSADFGIWLSRAEGWNLPLLECIACGTPALTTSWTGMSEYLWGYPTELKIEKGIKMLADDGIWFKGDRGLWEVPDPDVVTNRLKCIVENYKLVLQKERKRVYKE